MGNAKTNHLGRIHPFGFIVTKDMIYIMLFSCHLQALCNPTMYRKRLISWGHFKLFLFYIVPVVILSVVLNVPQTLSVTAKGRSMEANRIYMNFMMVFQLFHPLLTTVSVSTALMIWMNWKIIMRIKARRVRGVNRSVTRHMEIVQVRMIC